jgi:integrase
MDTKVKNPNHPDQGDDIKVEPIRNLKDIQNIKKNLQGNPRDFAIFVLGINTNLRGVDMLKLKVGQLRHVGVGEDFRIIEQKTGKERRITINNAVYRAIQALIDSMPRCQDEDYLFRSRQGNGKPISGPYLNNLVKKWCAGIKPPGSNFGAHTLRKTFGYHQRTLFDVDIPTLMVMFNHSTQKQTLAYLGIQAKEIKTAYMNEI